MKGFTLIETLIYTALVGLILSSVVVTMNTVLQARNKNQASLMLEENMRYALRRIITRTEGANNITIPAAGGSGSTLTLATGSVSTNPTVFGFGAGTLSITEGAGASQSLTGSHIEITAVTFTRLSDTPPAVRIQISGHLRNARASSDATMTLDETVSIRR